MQPITEGYLAKNFLGRHINVVCGNGCADPALNSGAVYGFDLPETRRGAIGE